jgi:DAACS family dicarboxylate/amino acid:cation (Na+ or H+) symporter
LERQILVGFAAGLGAGAIAREPGLFWLRDTLMAAEPIGTAFIRLITMVVVPLVIASVFVGVASLGDMRALGRVGGKTLLYFLGTTVAAATVGLVVALVSHVGEGLAASDRASLLSVGGIHADAGAGPATPPTVVQTLLNLIPQNPIASAAQGGGDLLPLIVAVCVFGAAATVITGDGRRAVVSFFEGVNDLSMVVIGWIMRLAPAAVFVLIAATIARSGLGLLDQLAAFVLVIVVALVLHLVVTLWPALWIGARLGVAHFARSVADALLLAFSTASSSATLPVSMAAARDRLGIPNEVVAFVLPAGTSLNKNGSAVYKAVTAVFLLRLYGLPLGPATELTIVLVATLAAFAGAGVPSSSLVTTLIVLNALGMGPRAAAGIALVAAVDRPIDMCRATVNTIGNLVGTAWIARTERRARSAEALADAPALPARREPVGAAAE